MYSTLFPAMDLGHIATVFFSGMPSDAAGPVADTVTPILTCACAMPASIRIAAAAPEIMALFIEPPRYFRSCGAMIAERRAKTAACRNPFDCGANVGCGTKCFGAMCDASTAIGAWATPRPWQANAGNRESALSGHERDRP